MKGLNDFVIGLPPPFLHEEEPNTAANGVGHFKSPNALPNGALAYRVPQRSPQRCVGHTESPNAAPTQHWAFAPTPNACPTTRQRPTPLGGGLGALAVVADGAATGARLLVALMENTVIFH